MSVSVNGDSPSQLWINMLMQARSMCGSTMLEDVPCDLECEAREGFLHGVLSMLMASYVCMQVHQRLACVHGFQRLAFLHGWDGSGTGCSAAPQSLLPPHILHMQIQQFLEHLQRLACNEVVPPPTEINWDALM